MIENECQISSDLARYLEKNYTLDEAEILPDEYRYSCLPLCLLDAIFSIGVTYRSTQNTVTRYCGYLGIPKYREKGDESEFHHSLIDMLAVYDGLGSSARFAEEVVSNKQRTSSRGGILKAEAAKLCAEALVKEGITTIAEFRDKMNPSIDRVFMSVKGQSSGISLMYLKMLCGKDDEAKPDRHILRFLARFIGHEPDTAEALSLLDDVTEKLKIDYPSLTTREIDYLIWSEMARQ